MSLIVFIDLYMEEEEEEEDVDGCGKSCVSFAIATFLAALYVVCADAQRVLMCATCNHRLWTRSMSS